MAEFLNRELRVNEALDRLTTLLSESRARVPAPVSTTSYTTLPDGRVLDRFGHLVYDPRPQDASTRP